MDFDPSIIRSGNTANLDTLIDVLKLLAVKHTFSDTGAGYSTISSASTTTLASLSLTLEADELVLFWTTMQVSFGATNLVAHIRHMVGGTGVADDFFTPPSTYATSSSGTGSTLRALSIWSGLSAGVTSFNLQWQNDGVVGAPLIYSVSQRLHALQFKIRS